MPKLELYGPVAGLLFQGTGVKQRKQNPIQTPNQLPAIEKVMLLRRAAAGGGGVIGPLHAPSDPADVEMGTNRCWFAYWPNRSLALQSPTSSSGHPLRCRLLCPTSSRHCLWVGSDHGRWGFEVTNAYLTNKQTGTNRRTGSLCPSLSTVLPHLASWFKLHSLKPQIYFPFV